MEKQEYQRLAKQVATKNNYVKNMVVAFVVGGSVSLLGELIVTFNEEVLHLSNQDSVTWMMIVLVFIATLWTALGWFDRLVSKCKAGLIIPITGFAHSICSSIIDNKKDGLITGIGSNTFKLAGCVIIYGILSGFVFALLRVVFNG